jgi:hypothetical protein
MVHHGRPANPRLKAVVENARLSGSLYSPRLSRIALRLKMKNPIFVLSIGLCLLAGSARAAAPDALGLLKLYLGSSIKVVSKKEIRYCPDNTCDIFRLKDAKGADQLPSFVYLYLFHKSDYVYLKKSFGGSAPFREVAKDQEPVIRKQLVSFCKGNVQSAACILEGMQKQLGISVGFGRYDEGKFHESARRSSYSLDGSSGG